MSCNLFMVGVQTQVAFKIFQHLMVDIIEVVAIFVKAHHLNEKIPNWLPNACYD